MIVLRAENIARHYGERTLFENISFTLAEGQKIALVARNGSGKSTLLRILAGIDESDGGTVVRNQNYRTVFLDQEPDLDAEATVWETLFNSDNELLACIKNYEEVLIHHEQNHEQFAGRLQTCMEEMDRLQAWDYEARIKLILGKLNILRTEQQVKSLSGGQQKRVALARVLIQQPDCIIMDEPTNHLDVSMIEWLEDYLAVQQVTILMVTHDRYFLDRVSNEILELDNGKLYSYKGNYAYFLEKKAERELITVKEIEKAKNLYRKELEWMRRQPKARGTKSKSRIDAFYDTKEKAHQKIEDKQVTLKLNMQRLGGKVMELHKLNKSFADHKILTDFSYIFKPGERVGIVGKNGVGKSTFLNMLLQLEQPNSGRIVYGDTVSIGYYSQAGMNLKEDKRVIEVVKDIAEFVDYGKGGQLSATQILKLFLFDDKQQYTYVSQLSGGEKRRLYLLTVLIKNPNFLILDEPTNDLDIATLNVLEDFLDDYRGCLLIVTHDRYFMDKLSDHLFIFEGEGRVRDFNGNYQDFLDEQEQRKEEAKTENKEIKMAEAKSVLKKKAGFKEQREYDLLTKEIEQLEKQKELLQQQINTAGSNHEELIARSKELEKVQGDLDEKSMRWLELSELIG
ncbi:MAG: ABC-F family ATP-binding cassette domain-containing protein [Bacteroidia bacterium]|nr:ABC-F family ATP-binding cassette domain-containing protein [Bacteroidia bacterium]